MEFFVQISGGIHDYLEKVLGESLEGYSGECLMEYGEFLAEFYMEFLKKYLLLASGKVAETVFERICVVFWGVIPGEITERIIKGSAEGIPGWVSVKRIVEIRPWTPSIENLSVILLVISLEIS